MLIEIKCGKSFLLHQTCLIQSQTKEEAENAITNLTYLYFQTFDSFAFPYFNSNFLHYIHLFCIRCFFLIDLFSNALYSFESLIFANILFLMENIATKLLISLGWHFFIELRLCETFTVINSGKRMLLIRILYKCSTIKCWSTLYLHIYVLLFLSSLCLFLIPLMFALQKLKISEIYMFFQPTRFQIFSSLTITWHIPIQFQGPLSMKAAVQRCSIKKLYLENSQNSQENTCARVCF